MKGDGVMRGKRERGVGGGCWCWVVVLVRWSMVSVGDQAGWLVGEG